MSLSEAQKKAAAAAAKVTAAAHVAEMQRTIAIAKLGFSGILGHNGRVVDRREHPNARSVPANSLLGIAKPRKINSLAKPGETIGPDASGFFEVGSLPAASGGTTDCGKRGINHFMHTHGNPPVSKCLNPGCTCTDPAKP